MVLYGKCLIFFLNFLTLQEIYKDTALKQNLEFFYPLSQAWKSVTWQLTHTSFAALKVVKVLLLVRLNIMAL